MIEPTNASAPPQEPGTPHAPRESRRRRILGSFWFNLLAAFLVVGLIQGFIVKLYVIPSASMEPTLETGDYVFANRLAYNFGEPRSGDVVVFTASDTWHPSTPNRDDPIKAALKWVGSLIGAGPSTAHTLAKRIIAVEGQEVECCSTTGQLIVDGTPLHEPYIYADLPFQSGTLDCTTNPQSQRCFGPFTVPEEEYFVLGDHRSNSKDSISDCRGQTTTDSCRVATVRKGDLVGNIFAIIWPIPRWSGVH